MAHELNRAKIPVMEYEQLVAQFNPVEFNTEESMSGDLKQRFVDTSILCSRRV
jgi:hypothetical protein